MKCKCGRTMNWTVEFANGRDDSVRVYHCPKCLQRRKDCDCGKPSLSLNNDGTISLCGTILK